MNLKEALQAGVKKIRLLSPSAQLDVMILLAHVLKTSKEWVLAHLDEILSEEQETTFFELVKKRSEGFPIAYLTHYKEFYGLPFYVEEGVLCPRPDSEILVETVSKFLKKSMIETPRILDVCTGSGALGISLKNYFPKIELVATDLSPISQTVFKRNSEQLIQGDSYFYFADLLEPLDGSRIEGEFDFVISNPPYLTTEETNTRISSYNWKEPALALDGGNDGLDIIRRLIPQVTKVLKQGGYFLLELDPRQVKEVSELMVADFDEISALTDLAGSERIIYACKK